MGFVSSGLSGLFYKLGERVGNRPKLFILLSVLVSLGVGSGLLLLKYENNVERLFTYTHGPYEHERKLMEAYFPENSKGAFDPSRLLRIGRFARLIILAKDGGTLLRKSAWNEIQEVDTLIHRVGIDWKDEGRHNYSTLCGRWLDKCFENKYLDLGDVMDRIENGSLQVSYPVMLNPETYFSHTVALWFGGVTLSDDSFSVASVKAVQLNYVLAIEDEADDERGYEWEKAVTQALEDRISDLEQITIYRQTFRSLASENDASVLSAVPYFGVTIFAMGIFLTLTSLSTDWVRAKPYAATLGMLCATLGSVAGFGLLCFFGVPIIGITSAVPFIMLGIGIDDTFVILASWRQTNPLDPVPKRLAQCYAEAGVSITITSVTDMLSFFIGILTPIPSIQIFSAYAGTSVAWIFFMQIFLFGGILAISGAQEARNMHGVCWWIEARPKSKSDGKSSLSNFFWTGGINMADQNNPKDRSDNGIMLFFRDQFSNYLLKTWVKVLVIVLFIAYLGVSCYGITTMEEGLQIKRIYREDSYLYEFIEKENEYFRTYPYRVQILITTPLDYSNETVQNQVYTMLDQMSNLTLMTSKYSENWLKSYTRYIKGYGELFDLNVTDESSFIDAFQKVYMGETPSVFKEDVRMDENGTQIIASRFVLQSNNIHTSEHEKSVVVALREIAENQAPYFNASIYHPWFHFADQYLIIRELTVKLIAAAAGIVMVVAILFIPNFLVSLSVFLTIATIEIGVMGFMSLWGISLDMISILCLIMCIGFSVDFSAHISYAYISGDGSSEDRIRKALYSLGLPILQGGISTVIGIAGMFLLPAYVFTTFAKLVVLVILFATWHGLFVLPVFLLIIRPERFSCKGPGAQPKKTYVVNASPGNDQL